jgi:phosphoglycerate dehydrogenase-like enzyme
MDLLIVEPLDPEVLQWLEARYVLRYAPALAHEPPMFRRELAQVRAAIVPPSVALDETTIRGARRLCALGRLSAGAENIDLEACARASIEVVRPLAASAGAEAEFVVGALLQMLRRVPVVNDEGLLVGRELGSCTVGLIGMLPVVRPLVGLLEAFGARTVGYDPALHETDALYARHGVQALSLRDLLEQADAVCVLLSYFSRYRGLLGERQLALCKPNQVLVSLAHSSLFDEVALADALSSGRLAAAWFDCMEPGALEPGRPLAHLDTLQITPRVATTTLESRRRSAWAVARRIDELLQGAMPKSEFRWSRPVDLADLADDRGPA